MTRNKVLVVDDEKNQREIYTMILEGEGFAVTTAQSGEQALRMARENDFDLVLTDNKMTGMDGLALLASFCASIPRS
jgi:CheY-like chemotaxis protein